MTDKIFIHEDKGGQLSFLKEVEAVKDAANLLIQTFESFQEFQRIATLSEFESLARDPIQYFDQTIRANATLTMTGGRLPDPIVLADLFGIDRLNYTQIVKGLPVTIEGCKPCQKLNIVRKAGKAALSHAKFAMYKAYLTFDAGSFNLNTEAIAVHLEQFKTFASTPAQLSRLKHWQILVDVLNEHEKLYGISAKEAVAKGLNLHLERAFEGAFMLNPTLIKDEILKNK